MSQRATKTIHRHGIWYLSDVIYERLTLFAYWEVLAFGCAVAFSLLLVYPYHDLQTRLAANGQTTRNDSLTLEYLRVFLKADPNNHALRLPLAKRLVQLGLYSEARQVLAPIHHDQALSDQAQWIELAMREQERYAVPLDAPLYAHVLAENQAQLRVLLQQPSLSVEQLISLGQKALAAGSREMAAEAFQRVARAPVGVGSEVYVAAAAATLGLGDYANSAALYFLAMRSSKDFSQKRAYYLTGLRTLQSGNLFDEALLAADRFIAPFLQDTDTLIFLARLARAANRPDAAARYAKLFLQLSYFDSNQKVSWKPDRRFDAHCYPTAVVFDPAALRRVGAMSAVPPVVGGDAPGLAFDEAAYTLGYEIFVGAKNLADARRVARAAVANRPNSLVWRQRLASLNDWDNLPTDALPQWLVYARLSQDELAWDRVLEISKGLNDLDSLRIVLEHKVQHEPHQAHWFQELLALYEVRGEPELAILLLQKQLGRTQDRALRETYLQEQADIYERQGDIDLALATTLLWQKEFGRTAQTALRIAHFYYKQKKFKAALLELYLVRDKVAKDDEAFWRSYAEMGSFLQNDEVAEEGYQVLLESEAFTENDLGNLLSILTLPRPIAANNLAVFGYFNTTQKRKITLKTIVNSESGAINKLESTFVVRIKTYPARFAGLALHLFVRRADWTGAQQFLNRLTASQLAVLEQDAFFLTSRAVFEQSTQQLAAAQRDMRAALKLDAGNMDLRAGLMWILIADRQTAALNQVLRQWSREAENHALLWGVYAAALMSLNRPNEALHWFRKSGFQRDDYLWQLSYAECLDANSQADLAWQIRYRAWLDLRKTEVLKSLSPATLDSLRDRLAALAPLFDRSDGAQRIIQSLLRADVHALQAPADGGEVPRTGKEFVQRLLAVNEVVTEAGGVGQGITAQKLFTAGDGQRPQDDPRLSASVKELALAYALNSEAHELGQIWLVTRFANQLARPLWGDLSLLLLADDRSSLTRLLDDMPDWLPIYDRVEAMQRVGSSAMAQTWAFDQFARLPADKQLHAQLTQLTLTDPSSLQWHTTSQQQGALGSTENSLSVGIPLSEMFNLTPHIVLRQQLSSDAVALPSVPAQDNLFAMTLRRRTDTGFIAATAQQRQAAVTHQGIGMEYAGSWARELNVVAKAGIQQLAEESTLLRLGGMRSGLESSVTYQISRRDYLRMDVGAQRYASQSGTFLGTGSHWNMELGTRLRLEYPDVIVRGFASQTRFSSSGLYDAPLARLAPVGSNLANFRFLPDSALTLGLSLGLGSSAEQNYVRGWRPFAEVGLNYNSISGLGYNLRGGAAGSVLGNDVLRIKLQRVSSNPLAKQGTQEFGVQYQWFY